MGVRKRVVVVIFLTIRLHAQFDCFFFLLPAIDTELFNRDGIFLSVLLTITEILNSTVEITNVFLFITHFNFKYMALITYFTTSLNYYFHVIYTSDTYRSVQYKSEYNMVETMSWSFIQ